MTEGSEVDEATAKLHRSIAAGDVNSIKEALVLAVPDVPFDLSAMMYSTATANRATGAIIQYLASEPSAKRGNIAAAMLQNLVDAGCNVKYPVRCNSKLSFTQYIANRLLMPGEIERAHIYAKSFQVAINAGGDFDKLAFIVWCYAGNSDVVGAMLAQLCSACTYTTPDATHQHNAECCPKLAEYLEGGARVCGFELTALQAAVISQNTELVCSLINAGSGLKILNLCASGSFDPPLLLSLQFFNGETLPLLLEAGADPNVRRLDSIRAPAITIAASIPYDEYTVCDAVACLLDSGADVNAADSCGLTALHIAVLNQMSAVCELLIANDANIWLKNVSGLLPAQMLGRDPGVSIAISRDLTWMRRQHLVLSWASSNYCGSDIKKGAADTVANEDPS